MNTCTAGQIAGPTRIASQIESQLDRLDRNQAALHKVIQEAQNILEPILIPEPSTKPESAGQKTSEEDKGMQFIEGLCPVADAIQRKANDIAQASYLLQKLLDRRGI